MVSVSRIEDAPAQILSASVRKTIQSIKEIVGNHSEADIYAMLKETNMDPNETAQKLLTQGPFHVVKRKRNKKKENTAYWDSIETRRHVEKTRQGPKPQTSRVRDNTPRGSFTRNTSRGITQEFCVVRENGVTQCYNADVKPLSLQYATSANEHVIANVPLNGTLGILTDQNHSDASKYEHQLPSQGQSTAHDYSPGHAKNDDPNGPNSIVQVQGQKLQNSRPDTATSSNSSVGLYSSSTDPVHMPSPNSKSSGSVGAIRREIGVVGVQRQSSEDSVTHSSVPSNSSSTILGKGNLASTGSFGQSPALSKSNQFSQTSLSQPVMSDISTGRSFSGSQYNSKSYQLSLIHQKGFQPNMKWKPKSSQKSSLTSPDSIGTCATPISSANNSTSSTEETDHFSESLSQNISEDQHVIIPQHLRVSEANHLQLTFGSFKAGFESGKGFISGLLAVKAAEEPKDEPAMSSSILSTVPICSSEDVSGGDEVTLPEDQSRSNTGSPVSDEDSGNPLDCCRNFGLVQSHGSSFSPEEPLLQQDPPSLPTVPAYDTQMGYDEPFLRSAMDENVRGQDLAPPQEALSLHVVNNAPPCSVAMVQQQPLAQSYPQVHISHFPNCMPYQRFLSPIYVPPVAMSNYSSNSSYPHTSSHSNYLLMQGGSSLLTAGGLKYATSQYKPVPTVGPSGYGNYNNLAGYTVSAPGTINNTAGIEDVSMIKYKEGNLYVPNPQAETSAMWIQTPRELPSIQSTPYYNLSGQAPHAAFFPSQTGHPAFNASAQSTHVPVPGLYQPPQPTAIANPHHLVHQQLPVPGMGANLGAPGPQVGAYQQPQLGHRTWMTNF